MANLYVNGIYREETPEELEMRQHLLQTEQAPEKNDRTQLKELQQQMNDLEQAYRKGVNA